MSKVMLGVVVKNSQNRFLVTKRTFDNMIDMGLISGLVNSNNIEQGLSELLISETGFDFSREVTKNVLKTGVDKDGEYIIFYIENNFNFKELKNISCPDTEFLWLSYNKIKKLYKDGKFNSDQFAVLTLGQFRETNGVKYHKNAMKVNHSERKNIKQSEKDSYGNYVKSYGEDRLVGRLLNGRKIKPCGRECWELGFMVVKTFNHISFENFASLTNDKEFLIKAAKISPNPVDCENYFYIFINSYLKKDKNFRLEFLKAIYLNENVYKLEDINSFVEMFGFEKENEIILNDELFMQNILERIENLCVNGTLEYHCSGEDKNELHDYKVKANEAKVEFENMKNGLTKILKSFSCYVEEKPETEETKDNFWDTFEPQPIRHMY